jgi:hypothetical protein
MTDDEKLMQQALEALDEVEALLTSMDVTHLLIYGDVDNAIAALRERLAQPSKPLTEEKIAEMMMQTWGCASIAPRHAPAFARAIEAAHGITGETKLQPAPDAGWQPIETAPKTGRKVILFYLNLNNLPRTVMARWLTDEQAAETDADGVGLEGGWYECIDNWDDYTEVAIHEGEPTHWMPLPAPPVEAAHGIKG